MSAPNYICDGYRTLSRTNDKKIIPMSLRAIELSTGFLFFVYIISFLESSIFEILSENHKLTN